VPAWVSSGRQRLYNRSKSGQQANNDAGAHDQGAELRAIRAREFGRARGFTFTI
jgi:hypothetical protein